ncbi:poly-gamma-glutamate hydrolase family protein [Streptomyces sp. NWU339]|uniref:poly-gamma-glutamate hydrolase family protein n=1 Tax=Streptomyces sp. NWU339 TaxID=2185284 RepID=UPI0011B40857|nr:poly-gamma-glutamate hydrolase family protein [Streptomyces sp. NWU339]
MPDVYGSYAELAAAEEEGVAYERRQIPSTATSWASIAIHGGGIEPGSGEVSRVVAAGLMNHYEFAGLLRSGNSRLHVTSTNFDEPIAEGIVAASTRTLSFHGYTGDGTPVTAIGGLDTDLRDKVKAALIAAGFAVIDAPQEISGTNPNNIVNENKILAGVQIEMSRPLRDSFFPNGNSGRASRDSGARTPAFYAYVAAIRQVVVSYFGFLSAGARADDCDAEYSARVVDRDGAIVAEASVLTDVEWSRLLNDTSTAQVTVMPDEDCCQQMGQVRSWRHQLYIYRNGVFVWGGPILSVEWSAGQVDVFAADISAWLARRVPHQGLVFNDSDLTDIASWLIRDAFEPDDPGHSVNVVGEAGVRGGREYRRNIGQSLDHLKDLAETGIDFTVVGSQIIILPDGWSQSVGQLIDADLPEGLVVAEDGAALGTRWIVAAGQDGELVGDAGGSDAYYGLLERYVEQTSIKTQASAHSAARALLRSSLPVPVFIDTREVTIAPEANIDVASLVPGWSLDISTVTTCRDITQRLKIVGVTVRMGSGGDGAVVQERVQVQVAASGAEAG